MQHAGREWTALREQSATILFASPTEVFYNPVQEVNRDISVAAIKQFARLPRRGKPTRLRVLEALSATGLRSVRYARELSSELGEIVANDLDAAAVAAIERNVAYNAVPSTSTADAAYITPNHGDAT